jgi:ribosomal protein L37E
MDNLTTCNRCGSDACYVQEVNEQVKLHFCYGCGFQANTAMTRNSEFFQQQMEVLPELYKELMGEDENGTIWMPSVVNIPDKGMVFADGPRADNWAWGAVKAVPMLEEEKAKFKAKGKEYDYKMDMTTLKHYSERDFIDALSYIGVLPE